MSINIFNGLCGSGKTRTAIQQIASHPNNKHIFVVPAIELANELTSLYLKHLNPLCITSENTKNTTTAIIAHLATYQDTGKKHVVVITHASFRLMDISKVKGWKVWHDEAPEAQQETRIYYQPNVPFYDYFTADSIGCITLTDLAMSSDNQDSLNDEMRGLIHSIKTGRFEAVLMSEGEDNYGRKWMEVMTTITHNYFPEDTTLMGANIEAKLVYSILELGDNLGEIHDIPGEVQNHYSDCINIIYAFDNFNTKTLRVENPTEYNDALQALQDAVHGPCIAVANSDVVLSKRFTRITHNVHGLNSYTDYKNVLFQSSLNVNNNTLNTLNNLWGITPEAVYMDRTVDTAYQVIMRGALRLDKSVDEYNVFVMDKKLAETLKEKFFPNANLIALQGYSIKKKMRGRPKGKDAPLTSIERKKIHSIRVKARAGYYEQMTNFRIIHAEPRAIIKMEVWFKTDNNGKLI